MTEIAIHQPRETAAWDRPPATISSGADRIREAAEVMALCKQLADAVCNTGMMPKHLRGKPEETAAVMLYGATLDLDPMQSVRSIYEVHGQPGLYARAMVALVMGRGHEVWTVATSDESVTVAGRRRGAPNVETSTWTIERATKAGYVPTIDPDTGKYRLNKWGKIDGNEKYLTDPQSMLYAKAASEVCRKVAPDVLAGVYAVEDLQSENWAPDTIRATSTVEQTAPAADRMAAMLGTQTSPAPDAGPSVEPSAPPVPADEGDRHGQASAGESPLLNTRGNLAKAMFAALNEVGIGDDERIDFCSATIGRTITSSKELTDDDARLIIDKAKSLFGEPETDISANDPALDGGQS